MAPKPPDSPDTVVRCVDGPHNNKSLKLRFLKNLSGGEYRKDPALYYDGLSCYRWFAVNKVDAAMGAAIANNAETIVDIEEHDADEKLGPAARAQRVAYWKSKGK